MKLGRRWLLMVVAQMGLTAAPAAVYRAGLSATYAQFDPNNPEQVTAVVNRVDAYPWFYTVPVDLEVNGYSLTRQTDHPWPDDVRAKIDPRIMIVRWSGFLFAPTAGTYRFELLADDLGMLLLDDREIVSHEGPLVARRGRRLVGTRPTVGTVELTAGMHRFELRYGNVGSMAGIFLRWQPPNQKEIGVIPAEYLLHDPTAKEKAPGEGMRKPPKLLGSGSGFVVHADGWLLTCHHVVAGGGYPSVLANGREVAAEVVASDARLDLALLRTSLRGLRPVALADVKDLKRQDEVLCFGFPLADVLGLDLSTENGRITALREKDGIRAIQTNAPVKPGNSGGPLVNLRAEVVGVVNARLEIHGAPEGVAFAVPIDYAATLLQKIPGFRASFGGTGPDLKPGDVDQRVSPSVLPVLLRKGRLTERTDN